MINNYNVKDYDIITVVMFVTIVVDAFCDIFLGSPTVQTTINLIIWAGIMEFECFKLYKEKCYRWKKDHDQEVIEKLYREVLLKYRLETKILKEKIYE